MEKIIKFNLLFYIIRQKSSLPDISFSKKGKRKDEHG